MKGDQTPEELQLLDVMAYVKRDNEVHRKVVAWELAHSDSTSAPSEIAELQKVQDLMAIVTRDPYAGPPKEIAELVRSNFKERGLDEIFEKDYKHILKRIVAGREKEFAAARSYFQKLVRVYTKAGDEKAFQKRICRSILLGWDG